MKMPLRFLVSIVAISLTACGGGGGSNNTGAIGLNDADTVRGTIRSPSGDAVPGVTVYIPGIAVSAQTTKITHTRLKGMAASDGTECEDPPADDQAMAASCSGADGRFSIDTSSIASNPSQLVAVRGSWRTVLGLGCDQDPCELTEEDFSSGTAVWPKVAVVTGSFDRMEDVLAKLADPDASDDTNGNYGRVNKDSGIFVYGSEYGTQLTIIDGTGATMPTENVANIGIYNKWDSYLDGTRPLVTGGSPVFNAIFIDCGNAYELSLDAAAISRLQDYVNAGGTLYVTDLAYDFVEQAFPQVMRFEGEGDNSIVPGELNDAQTGSSVADDGSQLMVNASGNSNLFSWLQTVGANRHDGNTPGNPDLDCNLSTVSYEQYSSAVTSSNLVPVGDFWGGWAHMISAHGGQSPTLWVSSGSGVTFDGLENRPLTVSMNIGVNGGKVIYSSYHTANSCPSLGFWPQERVLQYLMYQAF